MFLLHARTPAEGAVSIKSMMAFTHQLEKEKETREGKRHTAAIQRFFFHLIGRCECSPTEKHSQQAIGPQAGMSAPPAGRATNNWEQ